MGESIGEHLRKIRRDRQVSLRALARSAQISHGTLSRWEAGRNLPSISELESALLALGASAAERNKAYSLVQAPRAVRRLRMQPNQEAMPFGGDLLRALRERRGWTLEQTASAIGVQPRTVSLWEHSDNWPSDEKLHKLCYALNASSQELEALLVGGVQLGNGTSESIDELDRQLKSIGTQVWRPQHALLDLAFLSLENRIGRSASADAPLYRSTLAKTYVTHAQWLMFQSRHAEAGRQASKAWEIVRREPEPKQFWTWIIRIRALTAERQFKPPRPWQALRVLEEWDDVALRWPECHNWFLRLRAESLAAARLHDQALKTAQQALRGVDRVKADHENIMIDYAMILLKVGRPVEAMRYLPSAEKHLPITQIRVALARAKAYAEQGESESAAAFISRAEELAASHSLWRLAIEVETARQSLPSRIKG